MWIRLCSFKAGGKLKTYEFDSYNEIETKEFAEELAVYINAGNVLTITGELGAGKTTFTKGFAKGLGITRAVSSPTFTIIKEYQGKLPLYHMDAYRLEHSDEDIGFDEYFYGEGITVVEWAIFIEEFLPEERLEIEIEKQSNTGRRIKLTAIGMHFEHILEHLAKTREGGIGK